MSKAIDEDGEDHIILDEEDDYDQEDDTSASDNSSECSSTDCDDVSHDHNMRDCRSDKSSTTTIEPDGTRVCDCCYCEVFGHGTAPNAPTSRNFPEIRERLRKRLSKRRAERCEKSMQQNCSTPDSHTPKIEPQQKQKQTSSLPGDSTIEEILNFINGTSRDKSASNRKRDKSKQNSASKKNSNNNNKNNKSNTSTATSNTTSSKQEDKDIEKCHQHHSNSHHSNLTTNSSKANPPHHHQNSPTPTKRQQNNNANQHHADNHNHHPPHTNHQPGHQPKGKSSEATSRHYQYNTPSQLTTQSDQQHAQPRDKSLTQNDKQSKRKERASKLVNNTNNNNTASGKQQTNNIPNGKRSAANNSSSTRESNNKTHEISAQQHITTNNNNNNNHKRANGNRTGRDQTSKSRFDDTTNRNIIASNQINSCQKPSESYQNHHPHDAVQDENYRLLAMAPSDDVFKPRDIDLNDVELDEFERELEAFKRFCLESVPLVKKERVRIQLKDCL